MLCVVGDCGSSLSKFGVSGAAKPSLVTTSQVYVFGASHEGCDGAPHGPHTHRFDVRCTQGGDGIEVGTRGAQDFEFGGESGATNAPTHTHAHPNSFVELYSVKNDTHNEEVCGVVSVMRGVYRVLGVPHMCPCVRRKAQTHSHIVACCRTHTCVCVCVCAHVCGR